MKVVITGAKSAVGQAILRCGPAQRAMATIFVAAVRSDRAAEEAALAAPCAFAQKQTTETIVVLPMLDAPDGMPHAKTGLRCWPRFSRPRMGFPDFD